MAETTIEWAEESWNPIRARNKETGRVGHFCVHASPGCKKCYSERLQAWFGNPIRYAKQDQDKVEIFLDEEVLQTPLKLKRARDIFPCSMTDIAGEFVPDEWMAKMFNVMYDARWHRYLVLTKRAERMFKFITGSSGMGASNAEFYRNIWLGFSAEDQQRWDERAPYADELRAHGFNTWASCEPLLDEIDPGPYRVGWAVIGGESGPGARPTVIGHVRKLLQRFHGMGVPTFVKQLGAHPVNREGVAHPLKHKKGGNPAEWPEDLRVREMPA